MILYIITTYYTKLAHALPKVKQYYSVSLSPITKMSTYIALMKNATFLTFALHNN